MAYHIQKFPCLARPRTEPPAAARRERREAIKRVNAETETLRENRAQLQCQPVDDFEARIMSAVHLARVDPAPNMRQFYQLDVQPDLFAGFAVVKESSA
jgi:hypothetical protein